MQQLNFTYKPHIDGLRAIAVIIVILFHFNPTIFSGGYLGVDIFFVISGFVITQSLLKDYQENGRIYIFNFFIRRLKRIYPALVTVIFVTLTAYFFFGLLTQTQWLVKSGVFSIFAVSNLFFLYQGVDYFHQGVINPLAHTWSLGIEEQFYLIYPFLLAIGWGCAHKFKLKNSFLPVTILILSIISYLTFLLNKNAFLGHFYFPTARFWELGAGCALFIFSLNYPSESNNLKTIGALAVILSLQIFQWTLESIYIETLLVVLATSVIIYFGIGSEKGATKFLQHPVFTYLGRISYSLYLWHLPIIYFSDIYLDTTFFYIISSIATLGCAMLSYHFIEKPFRHSGLLSRAFSFTVMALPVVFIIIFSSVYFIGANQVRESVRIGTNNLNRIMGPVNYIESKLNFRERTRYNWSIAGQNVYDWCRAASKKYTLNNLNLRNECFKNVDHENLFFLAGDSHAQHLATMLDNSEIVKNLYFTEVSSCHLIDDKSCPERKWYQRVSNKTSKTLTDNSQQINGLIDTFRSIYYVLSWRLDSVYEDHPQAVESRLIDFLGSVDNKIKIILIAPTPEFIHELKKCLIIDDKYCALDKEKDLERRKHLLSFYKNLETKFKNVHLYDPHPILCPDKNCLVYDRASDFLIFMDRTHLSVEGSKFLTPNFDNWLRGAFGL